MSQLIRTAVAAFATTALALTLTVSPAEAAKPVKVKAKISIGSYKLVKDDVVFHGKVKAKKVCRVKRKVVLTQTDDKVRAGSAKTNKAGKWKVRFAQDDVAPGEFRAVAKRKVVKKKGKKIICKAAKVTKAVG